MYFFSGSVSRRSRLCAGAIDSPFTRLPREEEDRGGEGNFSSFPYNLWGIFLPSTLPSFATRHSTHNSVRKKRRREGIEENGAGGIIYRRLQRALHPLFLRARRKQSQGRDQRSQGLARSARSSGGNHTKFLAVAFLASSHSITYICRESY